MLKLSYRKLNYANGTNYLAVCTVYTRIYILNRLWDTVSPQLNSLLLKRYNINSSKESEKGELLLLVEMKTSIGGEFQGETRHRAIILYPNLINSRYLKELRPVSVLKKYLYSHIHGNIIIPNIWYQTRNSLVNEWWR